MRRKILERQDIAGRKRNDRIGIASRGELTKSTKNRDEFFDGPVVRNDNDQRAFGGALPQDEEKSFRCRGQAGHTKPPRALFQMGGYTQEAGKNFYVREEFANEGKKHRSLILAGVEESFRCLMLSTFAAKWERGELDRNVPKVT